MTVLISGMGCAAHGQKLTPRDQPQDRKTASVPGAEEPIITTGFYEISSFSEDGTLQKKKGDEISRRIMPTLSRGFAVFSTKEELFFRIAKKTVQLCIIGPSTSKGTLKEQSRSKKWAVKYFST